MINSKETFSAFSQIISPTTSAKYPSKPRIRVPNSGEPSMTLAPQTYRPTQIALHWIVVLGILFQWGMNEQMSRISKALQTGAVPEPSDVTWAWVHVGVGMIILLAVFARLFLRFRFGVPDHAKGTPKLQGNIAIVMHWALYTVLLVIVISGSITWNGIAPLGGIHANLNKVLFVLAAGHAGAALFNQFIRKDGTMRRMMFSRES